MIRLNRKGFTLVEIMIVVAIIALLAAIAIPNLLRARVNANQAAAQATLKSWATAAETFATAFDGRYPDTAEALVDEDPPFFGYDLDGSDKGGYTYAATDDDVNVGGYTATARANSEQTGGHHYQITTGAVLERTETGVADDEDYEPF